MTEESKRNWIGWLKKRIDMKDFEEQYISVAMDGYLLQVSQKELEEKDRIIAELKLSLNEADKKIKQLDTKPY